jgi:hypothetical protein
MNYFAHGHQFLDDPFFLAGTAIPDWLSVADRPLRVRRKVAEPWTQSADDRVAALARGIVQHHVDDAWFHDTAAFHEVSIELTRRIRLATPQDEGMRAGFLGHILVEILLDAELIHENPTGIEAYYTALARLEPAVVESALNQIAPRPTDRLKTMISAFCAERFLFDYAGDATLLLRLNQVLRRVGLETLPDSFAEILPPARRLVRRTRRELLPERPRAEV